MGIIDRLTDKAQEATGKALIDTQRLDLLEAIETDYRAVRREQELLGWEVLNYVGGQPHEVKGDRRRQWAQQARYAWMNDAMAGAAVDLLNDFTFGRGVPRPRARDDRVQEVIDEAWDDSDNQAVLTSYAAQIALGTDLVLQSNLFLLIFDEGDDGKIKLGLLSHDTVIDAVRDPENRLRVLYYLSSQRKQEWDFENDRPKVDLTNANPTKKLYYEHWRNAREAREDEARTAPVPTPPTDKQGDGRVYHITVNRTSEMVFGVPTMQRTLRWFSAYNEFMASRVDMTKAAAAFIMKRQIKGTPSSVAKLAARAISRRSELATGPMGEQTGPRPASVIDENEAVTHENFRLDSGAGNASQDALMLRAQVSAATRFPQHYLGDQGNANLATATSMELPVQKLVESRQELFEQLFRAFTDRAIERAQEVGRLPQKILGKDEEVQDENQGERPLALAAAADPAVTDAGTVARSAQDATKRGSQDGETGIDVTYEFSMPNPIRRLLNDLIMAIQTIARTFDPNNTNMELSKTLLAIALGEGLELQDPAEAVERIFPAGYVDPAVAAAQAAASQPPPQPPGPFDNFGGGGDFGAGGGGPGSGQAGPYGTKSQGTPPDQMQQAAVTRGRDGEPVLWPVQEARFDDLDPAVRRRVKRRTRTLEDEFDATVGGEARDALAAMEGRNGNGDSPGH